MKRFVVSAMTVMLLLSAAGAEARRRPWREEPPPENPAPMPAAPVEGTLYLLPGGFSWTRNMEDFTAVSGLDETSISGDVLYSPTVGMGFDFVTPWSGVGFDVFGSILGHDDVSGSVVGCDVSYILPHGPRGLVRPRLKVGIMRGTLDWEDNETEVVFEDTLGWQAGMAMEFGRRAPFYVELLYRDLVFDVDKSKSDTVSASSLDMSGFVLNFGVKFNFF